MDILSQLPRSISTLRKHYLTSPVIDPKTRGIPGVTIHFTTDARRFKVALNNVIIGQVRYDRHGKKVA